VGVSRSESEHTKRTFFIIIMFQGHPVCLDENVFFKKHKEKEKMCFRENEKLCVQGEEKKSF
jgi:hypothetical protein